MNLDFEINNTRFNVRASAIIYNKDKTKILLYNVIGKDYYLLPGGRIECSEDSLSAIKREMKEETGFDLEFELCSIQENFLKSSNKNIMQYCFCYKSIYNENITQEKFTCKDDDNQMFQWINISDLKKYKIVPNSTYELIKDFKNIKHIIEKHY